MRAALSLQWLVPARRLALAAGAVLLLIAAAWLLSFGPAYFLATFASPSSAAPLTQKDFLGLQNTYRATFAQIIAGVILAIGAYAVWGTWRTSRETQITQRFSTAIDQLGAERDDKSPKIETRLGAIYALERIARDSPRDHWTIVEVLSAYVRENAPWHDAERPSAETGPFKPRTDIQAALTVLGRRNHDNETERGRRIDLSATDLRGSNLMEARLGGADLTGADLAETRLGWARLGGADLTRAYLAGADLAGADLAGAKALTPEQIRSAQMDSDTRLPATPKASPEAAPAATEARDLGPPALPPAAASGSPGPPDDAPRS